MRSIQDALYNWLTIKIVAEARLDDMAAQETYELFNEMLKQEHEITAVWIEKLEEMYLVTYEKDGKAKSVRFPVEAIDCFLDQMNREPEKYKNY